MGQEDKTIGELIREMRRGKLRLPEMQRAYVWRAPQVCALLDSMYRRYPTGSILTWKSNEQVAQRAAAIEQEAAASEQLLLDGQQRITSLLAVISGEPVKVRGRKRPVEILFNLEHPDKPHASTDDAEEESENANDSAQQPEQATFAVSTKHLASLPHWVNITDFFKEHGDRVFLKRAGIKEIDHPLHEKYSERLKNLRRISEYPYRVDVLENSLSYEEVTNIFVRVNSLGTKLRGSDLALAQITAKWPGSLKGFESYQKTMSASFNIDMGILMRNLVAFASGQSRFATVGGMSKATLQDGWEKSKKGMDYAVNFLRQKSVGVESPVLLSSPYTLITLAAYGDNNNYEISESESAQLRDWVLTANAKGRYSLGASESILDQDLSELKKGGAGRLMEVLERQVGKLEISPNELQGRNPRLLKTMFLAFHQSGAKDWSSNLNISLSHSGTEHKLQIHHIFPKALLRGKYKPEQIDDICNFCFISGKQNRELSDNPPAKYFPSIINEKGRDVFDLQCIPCDGNLLTLEKYEDFLAKRREMIAKRLNEFLRR